MLVVSFQAKALDTNCYVVAPAAGEECFIIDPGIGVDEQLREVLEKFKLRPAAILATHGHFDHISSVTPVGRSYGVAVQIHRDDRYRLVDPMSNLDPGLRFMLEQQFGASDTWKEPEDVIELEGSTTITVAGIDIDVVHAPGHTEGCVLFRVDRTPDALDSRIPATRTIFSGDVLFAGSIGRTDLPGGDHPTMLNTLRDVVLAQDDAGLVLPGHGPGTTIGHERATNPYLQGLSS